MCDVSVSEDGCVCMCDVCSSKNTLNHSAIKISHIRKCLNRKK